MTISIIGLGLCPTDLTQRHLDLIEKAEVLAGGRRHLAYFPDFSGKKIEIAKDLAGLASSLRQLLADNAAIVVLASGDPLFYGIGAFLCREFKADEIDVYPNISAVAAAFARLRLPWQDARIISCHGRSLDKSRISEFASADKLAVMTGPTAPPDKIYEQLSENKITGFDICVMERLGAPEESLRWFAPGQKVVGPFAEPNLMILLRQAAGDQTPEEPTAPPVVRPGLPDELFDYEAGLITKSEIRAVTLAKLRLPANGIVWDLGAGSGAVAIEAAALMPAGKIFAVEKKQDRLAHIQANCDRFRVANVVIHPGVLPDALGALPDPDRIFIGGGGAALSAIMEKSAARLRPGGIMVVNTVLLTSMSQCLSTFEQLGFEAEITQIQINRDHAMPHGRMLQGGNLVWIIKGVKHD